MKTFVLLLTLALFAIPCAVSSSNSAVKPRIETQPDLDRTEGLSVVVAPASFTGTWKTFIRCKPADVTMTQVGNQVSGTYSPGNGKIFDGIVEGNKLSFKWIQDGGIGGIEACRWSSSGRLSVATRRSF